MNLILWRHAEAFDREPDMLRELTPKGLEQAEHMGQWLQRHLPDDTVILVSPATRTQQTAAALQRPFLTQPILAPGASANGLLGAASPHLALDKTVLLIGHQPTLGQLAMQLLTHSHYELALKKGAIIWLARNDHSPRVSLRAALSPEML